LREQVAQLRDGFHAPRHPAAGQGLPHVHVHADVLVRRGKGNKSRMVAISSRLAVYLRDFLAWKETEGQCTDPERPLFVSERRGHLSRSAVHRVWKAALARAGLLAVALFALLGLVIDGGRAVAAQSAATGEAEQAARLGAGQISVDALRLGTVRVDPVAAVEVAQAYLSSMGAKGEVTVAGQTVRVEIQGAEPTDILGIVGVEQIGISASASATNVHGVTRQDS